MTARSVYFTGPGAIEVRERSIPEPAADEVRVRTATSAISSGTELLIYRGKAPTEMVVDGSIDALPGTFEFPLTYGYAAVGQVTAVGADVSDEWVDSTVFAFHPHHSHFTAPLDALIPLPEGFSADVAVFLANIESAINFLMDGQPVIGERVAVFGQGVVGLLTTSLLAEYPLESLITVDLYERRREVSERFGADEALDPSTTDIVERLRDTDSEGTDLAYELTGDPDALNQAIDAMAYESRLVVGSWYGSKSVSLDLGGRFHRNRCRLVSSQVSSIASEYAGRWSKDRRLDLAWNLLDGLDPTGLITHRVPIERASEAYQLLDERPEETIQVLLTYK